MSFHRIAVFALVMVPLFASTARLLQGQDLVGAKAILRQVEETAGSRVPDDPNRWNKIVRELPGELAKMEPKEAAATWLQNFEQWLVDEERLQDGSDRQTLTEFVAPLPSPESWPQLVNLIEARPVFGDEPSQLRALGLRMLGHRLLGQTDRLKQDIDQASKLAQSRKKLGRGLAGLFGNLFGAPPDQLEGWRQKAKQQIQAVRMEFEPESAFERFREQLDRPEDELQGYLSIPDLVALVGRDQAAPTLEKALLLTKTRLNFELGRTRNEENATISLARELARKQLGNLSVPRWELCHSIETKDLFEAFWALHKSRDQQRSIHTSPESASGWYVMSLLLEDRVDDIVTFLNESRESGDAPSAPIANRISFLAKCQVLPTLERCGHSQKIQAALVKALRENPELPFWEMYVTLSAELGQTRHVLSAVNGALDRTNLPELVRRQLEQIRADALLAADRVDEGMGAYLTLLDEPNLAAVVPLNPETDPEFDAPREFSRNSVAVDDSYSDFSPHRLAMRVAEIGQLLQRDVWIQKGTDALENILLDENNPDGPSFSGNDPDDVASFMGLLIDLKQWTRAEHVLGQMLARQVAQDLENNHQGQGVQLPSAASDTLEMLLAVYHAAGRSVDVLTLLEDAPWWNKRDVSDWLELSYEFGGHHGERTSLPIPYIAAKALADVGRKEEARKIAEAIVSMWPRFDPGWQLALELMGDDFEKLAERVFSEDRFEERPLIWQARFHLDRGHLVQAEELIRRSIAIDPSDGEQGRNDRMRAYAMLAEILRQKKDDKAATAYDAAMQAIRLSEQADRFYAAGLLSRGIKMSATSLTLFADDYWIQSRLAMQLVRSGDLEGATKHYQRAFELMPVSFGRVDGFDCDGIFDGPLAENIATRVLAKLVADQPKNPMVHYLRGCLRSSQSRYGEAIESFREATRLDPDYLNAWQQILSTDDLQNEKLPIEVREGAIFQILRLDPLGRHTHADLSNVRDLAKLWTVLHDNRSQVPDVSATSHFSLRSSRLQLDAQQNARIGQAGIPLEYQHIDSSIDLGRRVRFQSHQAIRAIIDLMQGDQESNPPMGVDMPMAVPMFLGD